MSHKTGAIQSPFDPGENAVPIPDTSGEGQLMRGGRPEAGQNDGGSGIVGSPQASADGSGFAPGGGLGMRSGGGSVKETPNQSNLPLRVDGVDLGSGDPGEGGHVPLPDLGEGKGRTIPTKKLTPIDRK